MGFSDFSGNSDFFPISPLLVPLWALLPRFVAPLRTGFHKIIENYEYFKLIFFSGLKAINALVKDDKIPIGCADLGNPSRIFLRSSSIIAF